MNSANYVDIYQTTILSHNKSPKNFGKITNPCCSFHGQNQMCGDYVILHMNFEEKEPSKEILTNLSFEGEGCAILMASSSMMTELLKGKNLMEIRELMNEFRKILYGEIEFCQNLGEINIFAGLSKFSSRIQCAMLSWETLIKGINNKCQKYQ